MLSDERLATAMDCEGYYGINRLTHPSGKIQHSAKVGLAMVHPYIPTCLQKRFGSSLRPMPNPSGNHQLMRWEMVGNRQVGPVLEVLLPLSTVKRENIQNILDFLSVYHSMRKSNARHPRTHDEVLILDSFWKRAKELNRSAPATTERESLAIGSDSLNSQETARESSEAEIPDGRFLKQVGIKIIE
jgi:hypothetical protein